MSRKKYYFFLGAALRFAGALALRFAGAAALRFAGALALRFAGFFVAIYKYIVSQCI